MKAKLSNSKIVMSFKSVQISFLHQHKHISVTDWSNGFPNFHHMYLFTSLIFFLPASEVFCFLPSSFNSY